jgi:polyphenol oxidase
MESRATAALTGEPAARVIREERLPGPVPIYRHPDWAARCPWLVQGTTGRGNAARPFDCRLFGPQPAQEVMWRWRELREATGLGRAVHSRQVHGAGVLVHEAGPPGLFVTEGWDGHLTGRPDVMLTVSVADCVPIFLLDERRRQIALLHGGWRGIAAGVLEAGVSGMARRAGIGVPELAPQLGLHLGPSICGRCYEVGPEVHAALGLPVPDGPAPVDLRRLLASNGRHLGITASAISISAFCTRCDDAPFFSHRAGHHERQLGIMGMLADQPTPGTDRGMPGLPLSY